MGEDSLLNRVRSMIAMIPVLPPAAPKRTYRSPSAQRYHDVQAKRRYDQRRYQRFAEGLTPGQRAARAEYLVLREQRAARFNSVQPLGRPRLNAKRGRPPEYPV